MLIHSQKVWRMTVRGEKCMKKFDLILNEKLLMSCTNIYTHSQTHISLHTDIITNTHAKCLWGRLKREGERASSKQSCNCLNSGLRLMIHFLCLSWTLFHFSLSLTQFFYILSKFLVSNRSTSLRAIKYLGNVHWEKCF